MGLLPLLITPGRVSFSVLRQGGNKETAPYEDRVEHAKTVLTLLREVIVESAMVSTYYLLYKVIAFKRGEFYKPDEGGRSHVDKPGPRAHPHSEESLGPRWTETYNTCSPRMSTSHYT